MSNINQIEQKSSYRFNEFGVVDSLYPYRSESWERVNILLTKFQQRTFYNDYVLGTDGEVRYVFTTKKELKNILGSRRWESILLVIVNKGVIKRVDASNPFNGNQQLYTFEAFRLTPNRYDVRVHNHRVHKSLDIFYDNKNKNYSKMVGGIIIANLRNTKINITDEQYWSAVNDSYTSYCVNKNLDGKEPMNIEEYRKNYLYLLYRIRAFNSAVGKEIYDFITEDKFSGRVHTIITQLPKFIRELGVVEVGGRRVAELDLKQSQPTILAKVLEDTDYSEWFYAQNDCYEALQREFGIPTRDAAKKLMFSLMFSTKWSKHHKQFETMFPQAGAILTQMKSTYNPNNPRCVKGNFHSNVAYEMQKRETTIFRYIWKRLNKKGIEFLTIHDAILIPIEDIATAKFIMQSELTSRFPTAQINVKTPLLVA